MSVITYDCKACGAVNKLEEKFCSNCGVVNELRIKKIADLDSKINKIEKKQGKAALRTSKIKTMSRDGRAERKDLLRTRRARKIRMTKTKLNTGDTHEGKLRWVKIQRYDLKRSIPEIADDLCESMNAVAKYIDEIENQKNE